MAWEFWDKTRITCMVGKDGKINKDDKTSWCGTQYESKSTTSIFRHLLRVHGINAKDYENENKKRPKQMELDMKRLSVFTPSDKATLHDLIFQFGVKDNIPARLLDSDSFNVILKFLKVGAASFHRNDFPPKLHAKVLEYKDIVRNLLNNKDIAISFDLWTAQIYKPIIGVVAYYIDCFELKELFLTCGLCPYPHNKENIKRAIKTSLDDYNIEKSRVLSVTVDNASNLRTDELLYNDDPNEHIYNPIRCVLHTLNLSLENVEAGFGSVYDCCKAVKDTYKHFKNAAKRRQRLEKCCDEAGIESKSLLRHVDTRWNSYYECCKRLLYLQQPLELYMTSEEFITCTTDTFYEIPFRDLELLVEVLADYEHVFKTLQTVNKPTYAYSIGMIFTLNSILHSSTHPWKKEFIQTLDNRFPSCSYNKAMAAFFVPEFKQLDFVDLVIREQVYRDIKSRLPQTRVTAN